MTDEDKKIESSDESIDNSKKEKLESEKPVEKIISLNEIAEKIYEKVYGEVSKNVNEIMKNFNNSLGNISYRLFSVELILYKFIKESNKEKIDKDMLNEIMLQEDIIVSNVETMLKRIEEVKLKNKKDLEDLGKKDEDKDMIKKEEKKKKQIK